MHVSPEVQSYQSSLQKRIEENEQDVEALISLGALEFEYFRNDEEAILLLEKAIHLDPLNIKAKFWLAMCLYYDCFAYSKAEKLLNEALQLDPNRPECLSLMAWIVRESKGPVNRAMEYVQKAIAYAPDWPMLRFQLARLFLSIGKFEAAEKEVQLAMQMPLLDPKDTSNDVERYYENVVTGRIWNDKKKAYDSILESIQKSKNTAK